MRRVRSGRGCVFRVSAPPKEDHPIHALALAFWKRSLAWGLAVVNVLVLFKIGWTFLFSTEAGAMSHLPAAVLGLLVCDAVLLYLMRRMRARASYSHSQPEEHHG